MEHIPLRLRKLRAKNTEYLQMSKVANVLYVNILYLVKQIFIALQPSFDLHRNAYVAIIRV